MGNFVKTIAQNNTYTAFNKVQFITEGDYRLQIIYGPDNQRKKTVLYHDANAGAPLAKSGANWVAYKTRYFVGGIYEEEIIDALTDNTREINYVTGGDGLAAIFEKDDQGENLYYIHKDHLGSYQAISNSSGALVEEMNYDPWGRRREATDWENYFPTTPMFTRGFTGHEHLPEFNLINMNGRVYDPILGRFLSPDNYVQMADYTQNFNRYSYALNNPLIFTDPSGEKIRWPKFTWFNAIPIIGQFDYLFDFINANTVGVRQKMVDANIPSIGVGYNSTYGTGFYVGNNPMFYPGYEKEIATGQQNISNQLAGFSGWDGNSWQPFGFDDLLGQQFVGESPLVGGVASSSGGTPWYSIYNWPALGSSARTMDAMYAGNYLEAGIQFATCAAEVFTFGYASEINLGAKTAVGSLKMPVYRVYGEGASMYGKSYSLINPKYVPFYRNFAGLPEVNSGQYLLKGSIPLRDINVGRWFAAPLNGNTGGLPFELYQSFDQLMYPANVLIKKPF